MRRSPLPSTEESNETALDASTIAWAAVTLPEAEAEAEAGAGRVVRVDDLGVSELDAPSSQAETTSEQTTTAKRPAIQTAQRDGRSRFMVLRR